MVQVVPERLRYHDCSTLASNKLDYTLSITQPDSVYGQTVPAHVFKRLVHNLKLIYAAGVTELFS